MTHNLDDLNNHLFSQLNRLSAGNLTPEQIDQEVKRASAIVSVADQITSNSEMRLKAAKLFAERRWAGQL